MPLKFRPAEPRDAEQVVPLIYSSGPAAFDYAFRRAGLTAEGFLQAAFVDGAGMFGYPRHWVGELGGKVVATGTGYSGEVNLRNMLSATRQIMLCYGPISAFPVMFNGLRLEQIILPPPRQTYYLAHLGVAESMRGEGIGTRLVEHLLKLGRAAGFQRAALDVAASNPQAQALYERLGFVVEDERVSRLSGIANHRFMTRAL